jgi:leucyl/phenylalanyl-tRNA---protein transferase
MILTSAAHRIWCQPWFQGLIHTWIGDSIGFIWPRLTSCMPRPHRQNPASSLPWLAPGEAFPPASQAWGPASPAPGLLAGGADLSADTLKAAYSQGIFPWYSAGQPPLWWSPDPRMVLQVAQFKLHRSLRKTLQKFVRNAGCEVRFDTAFEQVIRQCAARGKGAEVATFSGAACGHPAGLNEQNDAELFEATWIQPDMIQAYVALHRAGAAHSVETWRQGELVGGLYLVNLGRGVFGESMFSRQADASKIALAALVAFCRAHGLAWIDCQQNTGHLASLGAAELPRGQFLAWVKAAVEQPRLPSWEFKPLYWNEVLATEPPARPAHPAPAQP